MKYRGTTEEQRVENTRERTEGMEAGGRKDRPARWRVEIPPAGVIYTASVLSVAWRDNDVAHEGTRSRSCGILRIDLRGCRSFDGSDGIWTDRDGTRTMASVCRAEIGERKFRLDPTSE